MSSDLTPDAIAAICAHMNDDHADAIVAYARHYANTNATKATMIALDATGMNLAIDDIEMPLRIPFDHELRDTNDARTTLIKMAQESATP